jgi:hypothetical protein
MKAWFTAYGAFGQVGKTDVGQTVSLPQARQFDSFRDKHRLIAQGSRARS